MRICKIIDKEVKSMKITDYQRIKMLSDSDILLIDGENGTKTISTSDLTKEILRRTDIYDILDEQGIPVSLRRNTFRGKNLGEGPTSKDYDEIDAGTFKGLFLGDYWRINNKIYRIVDFNYWLETGDKKCTTNHLVIMPDNIMYSTVMNDTDTTAGGYVGSKMRISGLTNAKNRINSDFGEEHILNHREILVNKVTNGYPEGGDWYDSTVELPNEIMMYGSYIFTPAGNGTIIPYRYQIDKTQLALMQADPAFVNTIGYDQWIRDIVSSQYFAHINSDGRSAFSRATYNNGVRPVFGLKK